MKRGLVVGMALALMTAPPAFAGTHHSRTGSGGTAHWGSASGEGDDGPFSAATLNGTYIFEASGFMNDGAPGSAVVLGTLTFDGVSAVTGNLTVTAGDSGQWSCSQAITSGGTYPLPTPVSGPGLGTLVLPGAGGGSINFNLLVPSTEGKTADAIGSDNAAPTAILCPTMPGLTSMVLKGHLTRIGDGGGD